MYPNSCKEQSTPFNFYIIMKKFFLFLFTSLTFLAGISSCSDDSVYNKEDYTTQTLFVYMPWTGSDNNSGLYPYFLVNIDSMEAGVKANSGLNHKRLLIYLNTSATAAKLFEVNFNGNACTETTLKEYTGKNYLSASGMAGIFSDAFQAAPALNYAMIIGCHGNGWTFKDDWTAYPSYAKSSIGTSPYASNQLANKNKNGHPTRFFGSVDDIKDYSVDIPTLSEALTTAENEMTYPSGSNHKLQYLLFDDCYMANVETAYELRNVTNFLIGSTSEIMAEGMPYYSMWNNLSSASPSYSNLTSSFYNYYSKYSMPYGTISVTDCRQMDNLATFMKTINSKYTLVDSLRDSVQVLDGFGTPIFYDMTSYVDHLGLKKSDLNSYAALISKVVVSAKATSKLYSALGLGITYRDIKVFSGLTISDLSQNSVALKGKEKTSWWSATH